MKSEDVKRCVNQAVKKTNVKKGKPSKLLSDNGLCYVIRDLKTFLAEEHEINHIRGKPLHPQTQGNIECYHRSIKSVVLLDHYCCPEQLTEAIAQYVT